MGEERDETTQPPGTRLLFCGDESLADGFRLIGFEAYSDPEPADVDRLFSGLLNAQEHALVIVDDALMAADIPALRRARREGGRILVIAVPPLRGTPQLASDVADRLGTLFSDRPIRG